MVLINDSPRFDYQRLLQEIGKRENLGLTDAQRRLLEIMQRCMRPPLYMRGAHRDRRTL